MYSKAFAKQVGTSMTGLVQHAIKGEWSYTSQNFSECGVPLSCVETMMISPWMTVTCKSCSKGERPEFYVLVYTDEGFQGMMTVPVSAGYGWNMERIGNKVRRMLGNETEFHILNPETGKYEEYLPE